jgi:hypothetical protein
MLEAVLFEMDKNEKMGYNIFMNKNDMILNAQDIENQMPLSTFKYRKHFSFLCNIVPDIANEKLNITNPTSLINKKGVLYLFVIDGKLIKVGSSTVSFKDRLASYNCGKKSYRENGTCSTTNYLVLQSFLSINKIVEVYAFFPEEIAIDVWGESEIVSLPAKRFEKRVLTELKEDECLPIMCTQK